MDVLTAAHVVDKNGDSRYDPATDGIPYIRTSQNANVTIGMKTYRVASVTVHPGYRQVFVNGKFQKTLNDLAILHLETYENDAIPAVLNRTVPRVDDPIEFVGFGKIGKLNPPVVQDNTDVRHRGYAYLDTVAPQTLSWAIDEKDEGTTRPGDSGGPSFLWSNALGKRVLAGVTSYGDTNLFKGATATVMRVDAYVGWIDSTIASLNSSTAPSATVITKHDITSAVQSSDKAIRITYTSATPIQTVPGKPVVALIGPNGYYNQTPRLGLTITSSDGTSITQDYYFDGPGGTWSSRDNGTYTMSLLQGGIVDSFGTSVKAGSITTINVSVPVDNTPPTALSDNRSITVPGRTNFVVQVKYSDTSGIDGSSLGNDDVQLVKSDGSFVANGRLMIPGLIRNTTTYHAMYEFQAPGGAWDASDNGTYRIVARSGAVRDVSRNLLAGGTLATLTVNIAGGTQIAPWAILNASNITTSTTTHTFTVTYYDDRGLNLASIQQDIDFLTDISVFSSGLQWTADARLVSVDKSTNTSPIVATYRWVVPSAWKVSENGTRFDVFLSGVTDTDGNGIQGGYIGAFQLSIPGGAPDTTSPQAFVSAPTLTSRGVQAYSFETLFTDDVGVNATSITPDSLIIIGPNGEELTPHISYANLGENSSLTPVGFNIPAPAGEWDPSDNGQYRIVIREGTVTDSSGNYLPGYQSGNVPPAAQLAAFTVAIDTEPPPAKITASLTAENLLTQRDAYEFTVRFSSVDVIDLSTIGDEDVYVTDTSFDFAAFATKVATVVSPDGKTVDVVYRIVGPNGSWKAEDNGDYLISLSDSAVSTVSSATTIGLDLGGFSCSISGSNHAPTLNASGDPRFPNLINGGQNNGILVADLIGGMGPSGGLFDLDPNGQRGIGIIGANNSSGEWQFSLNNGGIWQPVGNLAIPNARLLGADSLTRVRFVPRKSTFTGTVGITFIAWDRTTGNNGELVAAAIRGGTSAFSTQNENAFVTVVTPNLAPVLNPAGDPRLPNLINGGPNNGMLISELITAMNPGGISDPDTGALRGIAVIGANNSSGDWQFSTDNGTTWQVVGSLTLPNARLLAADSLTRIRFVPRKSTFTGTVGITFIAWDRTSGSNGELVAASTRGGMSAFSSQSENAFVTVVKPNLAPVLNPGGDPKLPNLVNGSPNIGILIADLIASMGPTGGISDPNLTDGKGIGVIGANNVNGEWQFSTNNGTSWQPVGATPVPQARLLAADTQTRIRFVPRTATFVGTVGFTFIAWDQTEGTNGELFTASLRGAASPFSSRSENAFVTVVLPNRAPVLNPVGDPRLPNLTQGGPNNGMLIADLIGAMSPGGITDADAGALRGIAVIGANNSSGEWQFSTNNGTNWQAIGALTVPNVRLLSADAQTRIRFIPKKSTFTGTVGFTFIAWDRTAGNNGELFAATTRGGNSGFSSLSENAFVTVSV